MTCSQPSVRAERFRPDGASTSKFEHSWIWSKHCDPYSTASKMFSRPRTARIVQPLECLFRRNNAVPRRTLISAPKPNDGPLMSRRSDRALPSVSADRKWLKTMPIFLLVVTVSTLAIFNYQKSSSSVVNSTLYALRTNAQAREVLGDEVYFASQIPWIWGKMNQLHGKIDIQFWVKGTRQKALMRFKSERKTRMGYVSDTLGRLRMEGTI